MARLFTPEKDGFTHKCVVMHFWHSICGTNVKYNKQHTHALFLCLMLLQDTVTIENKLALGFSGHDIPTAGSGYSLLYIYKYIYIY